MRPQSEESQRRLAAEREKERMKALNSAFDQLRSKLKLTNGRKLTKIRTLRLAIEYIAEMQQYLSNEMCVDINEPKSSHEAKWMFSASTSSVKTESNIDSQCSSNNENATTFQEPASTNVPIELHHFSIHSKRVVPNNIAYPN